MRCLVCVVLVGLMLLLTPAAWAGPKDMSLRVTDPGKAAEWLVGATNNLKWSFSGELGPSVTIRLQRNGWVNARIILFEAAPIGANRSGSFKWKTPADLPPGENYTVSVTAENGIGDTSAEFKLIAGKTPVTTLTLDALPKGSARWVSGATVSLRWSYAGNPGPTVKLALIKKEVGVVAVIAEATPLGIDGKGRLDWTVPKVALGNDYYIGIVSTTNVFYQDMGKEPVVITAAK